MTTRLPLGPAPLDPAIALCIGNIFLNVVLPDLSSFPEAGKLSFAETYEFDIGGGAAITSVALARLGFPSAVAANIGDDLLGQVAYNKLAEESIDLSRTHIEKGLKTNVAIEMVVKGRRTCVSARVMAEDIPSLSKSSLEGVGHVHLKHLTPQRLQLIHRAKEIGITTSLDADLRLPRQRALLAESTGLLDFVMVNREEGLAMLPQAKSIEEIATCGSRYALRCFVLKLDSGGAMAVEEERVISLPAFPINVQSSVGAGDAFNAGFLYAYLNKRQLTDCLIFGNCIGALSLRGIGASTKLPTLDEACRYMEEMGYCFN